MKPVWYFLFPLLVFYLVCYVAYKNYPWWEHTTYDTGTFDKWFGWIWGGFSTLLLCGLSLSLAYYLSSFIGTHSDQVWQEYWRGHLVSARSTDGVQGRISGGVFLVSGFVESRQVYFYYTVDSGGAYRPGRWAADSNTYVFEEDRKDGEVVQFDAHFKHAWVGWFAEPDDSLKMEFHVPKGSVQKMFAL